MHYYLTSNLNRFTINGGTSISPRTRCCKKLRGDEDDPYQLQLHLHLHGGSWCEMGDSIMFDAVILFQSL